MAWWEAILDSLGGCRALVVLAFVVLFVRRRCSAATVARSSAASEPAPVKNAAASARGWTLGLGRYSGDQLEWFRIFSFSPAQVHLRPPMTVAERRTPHGAEAFSLYPGHVGGRRPARNGRRSSWR